MMFSDVGVVGNETGAISTGGRVRPPPAPKPSPPLFSLPEDDKVIRGGIYKVKASLNKFARAWRVRGEGLI